MQHSVQQHQEQILNQQKSIYLSTKTPNINLKCTKQNEAHYACMNIKCKSNNAIICNQNDCKCKQTHQHCINIQINKLTQTIQNQAYSFNEIKSKIINIFDKAIDQLSQTQDKLILKYQQLFQQKAYTKDQRKFLLSLQKNQNIQITCDLIFRIITNVYNRKQQNQIIVEINHQINSISLSLMKDLNTFQKKMQYQISLIQNTFTDKIQSNIWGLFDKSTVIQKRKDALKLLNFFETSVIDSKLLYRGSQNQYDKKKFKQVCADTQNILILIKTQTNKLIGGFTPLALPSTKKPQHSQNLKAEEFLFSITEGQKLPHKQKKRAMLLGQEKSQQIFSFGYDFSIANKPNLCHNSVINLQGFYINEKFKNNKQGWMKFTGSSTNYFCITEMEVWKLLLNGQQQQISFDQ